MSVTVELARKPGKVKSIESVVLRRADVGEAVPAEVVKKASGATRVVEEMVNVPVAVWSPPPELSPVMRMSWLPEVRLPGKVRLIDTEPEEVEVCESGLRVRPSKVLCTAVLAAKPLAVTVMVPPAATVVGLTVAVDVVLRPLLVVVVVVPLRMVVEVDDEVVVGHSGRSSRQRSGRVVDVVELEVLEDVEELLDVLEDVELDEVVEVGHGLVVEVVLLEDVLLDELVLLDDVLLELVVELLVVVTAWPLAGLGTRPSTRAAARHPRAPVRRRPLPAVLDASA